MEKHTTDTNSTQLAGLTNFTVFTFSKEKNEFSPQEPLQTGHTISSHSFCARKISLRERPRGASCSGKSRGLSDDRCDEMFKKTFKQKLRKRLTRGGDLMCVRAQVRCVCVWMGEEGVGLSHLQHLSERIFERKFEFCMI